MIPFLFGASMVMGGVLWCLKKLIRIVQVVSRLNVSTGSPAVIEGMGSS